ncbi:acyl-CoA dehydrogenase [Rickettsiella endosymbiont of Dermanyssus gallinae]|uniref:acyl-CoA dehydrogenase n=1 Tax=Rickettsiella endosymbiont of Dermanyssus gallinae TaxID=2856608 RepID=UPI001C52EB14|nr:acyl-CoA dehydrogenase [Rickettsiella endosymbiont of Dermanyssus gallinae]
MLYLLFSLGIVILSVIIILSIPLLRRSLLVKPLFPYLKKALPSISKTEEVVLEAGDMWWEKDLFRGKPDWQALHKIPLSILTAEEQSFLDNQVEALCHMLNDYEILTKYHDLPPSVWDNIKQNKFFGMVIPKKYGGLGFSALAHSSIVLKIATRSVSAAVTVLVPNSLGPAELLLHYGTEDQKDYYLPRLATGQEIPCFALTSVKAGSDATAITDSGIVCKGKYKDKEVLGIRLNFNKRYITLAPIATVIGVAFKLFDPDLLIGSNVQIGITVALVPSNLEGVEAGHRHSPMGLAFLNGPIRGKEVFIPLDFVIGGEKMLGQGWRMLIECLSIGRGISLPAVSAAQTQLAYRMTGAYSVLREQFNQPLVRFEGVEAALARMAGLTYLMEATRRFTVTAVDASLKPALASSIAKYHMTEFARTIVNGAMDIHGGRGIQLGPRNYLAQGYIAIPISITVEGANILTRNLIVFGQGAVRCHPFLMDEVKAIQKNDIRVLDKLLASHVCYVFKNLIKTFSFAFGIGRFFVKSPLKKFRYYYCQLSRMSAALAYVTDVTLLVLGGSIKRRERLSARLGDVLSYLYLASSALRYYQEYASAEDDCYLEWNLKYCLYHIQIAFEKFFMNFPSYFLGRLLQGIVFPLGRSFQPASDKLDAQLLEPMKKISAFRDRMTQDCYLRLDKNDITGRMELAFTEWMKIETIRNKIRQLRKQGIDKSWNIEQQLEYAVKHGMLSRAEVEQFLAAETLQQDSMQVDEF